MILSADPEEPTLHSRHCRESRLVPDPSGDPQGALRALEALGATLPDRPVLLYGTDAELLLLSRNRERLLRHFRFNMPAADLVEQLVNKTAFARLAARLELPTPCSVVSAEIGDARELEERVPLPCVMKPNVHIGWFRSEMIRENGGPAEKVLRVDDRADLAGALDRMRRFSSDFVVQEYIPGGEDMVYSFHAYLGERSRPLAHYVGRKIRTYPRTAGRSTYLRLVEEPEVTRLGLEVLERLDFTGVVKIDFKLDPRTGRFRLLELNPRFNLWHYLGARSGINIPRVAYDDLMGRPVTRQSGYSTDLKWLAFADDFRAFLRSYHPEGQLSWRQWLLSLRGRKVYDVFAWDDPRPFLVSSWRYLKALWRRLRR